MANYSGNYRNDLPQLSGDGFITDAGLETVLIFLEGIELPDFAAFILLKNDVGRETLKDYFRSFLQIAESHKLGCVLESATWRASRDWAERLGYSTIELDAANKAAIAILVELRAERGENAKPIVISGCVGPRGDGYKPAEQMRADQAEAYHAQQIASFKDTEADMISAITMTNVEEAIGIARAALQANLPSVISFTVETDGLLPTGDTLGEAIRKVDEATDSAPQYYMINCAHPSHFSSVLSEGEDWTLRIRGLRPNASALSHAELDEAEEIDDGNPDELGRQIMDLRALLPNLAVVGGCCGTDQRHVEEMAKAFAPAAGD